jgi:hypothetical protein
VSIAVGETAFVYFNGTDYVKVVGTATAGAAGGSNTQVQYNNAGVLAGITGATTNGTALTLVAPNLGSPASVGTMPAFTLGGTVSGGGNQINNVIIGTSTPLAGSFTTLSASSTATLSGLTASTALALDASKNIVSVTNTGTGSNVLATSPTLVTPALGTPSALVGTNITGTATNFNINGTVGATTPATGNFTTLTENSSPVVIQTDIGTGANEIPLNQYLGKLAYEDTVGLFATLNPAPTIASAATIQPLAPITFVSGTTTINTITVPSEFVGGGQITLIPTALWSTGTSGNIAIATTGVVSKALILSYDATTAKWYPSY